MKRFIKNLTAFLLIQLFIWAGVLWVYVRHRPLRKEYMAAALDKHQLLEQQPSPRLVLIGGSNVAFGYDSAEIKRRLAYNPVNMGLHVGLGVEHMLEEVEPLLRPGDVVVVSFEYALFEHLYDGIGEILLLDIEQRPEDIRSTSLNQAQLILNDGYHQMSLILNASINYFGGETDLAGLDRSDNVYKRSAFDEYGDVALQRSLPPKGFILPEGTNPQPTRDKILRVIDRLNRFGEVCRQKGVKIFYSYPPLIQSYFNQTKDSIHEIATTLSNELKFQIINTPDEMSLPAEDFFDTVYHLNDAGIRKRTDQLIERLSERLERPAALD